MGEDYKNQINLLKDELIDIAFVPVDPRLEKNYLLGLDYLVKIANVKVVFPMHFGDNFSVFNWIKDDNRIAGYRNILKTITCRGEKFEL
jgi:L-ascorbate metabolism protein UlaG (beta-lactamase superfamily)